MITTEVSAEVPVKLEALDEDLAVTFSDLWALDKNDPKELDRYEQTLRVCAAFYQHQPLFRYIAYVVARECVMVRISNFYHPPSSPPLFSSLPGVLATDLVMIFHQPTCLQLRFKNILLTDDDFESYPCLRVAADVLIYREADTQDHITSFWLPEYCPDEEISKLQHHWRMMRTMRTPEARKLFRNNFITVDNTTGEWGESFRVVSREYTVAADNLANF